MADDTPSSLDTLVQGVGDRLDVLDATRARELVAARLFPRKASPVRVGRYELRDMLGAGGMGVVYAALDPKLDREVAIKMLRPSGEMPSTDALVREARALARVSHPHVVGLYDVGTDDDELFFVMELVRGQTLDRWCAAARARVDDDPRRWVPQVLRAYVDAGTGLAAVHDAGLVHLDFKPGNVLAGDDGRVRVTDFGVVRLAEQHTTDMTRGGPRTSSMRLGGTPAYMSPEQFAGGNVDLRSDVFSYCVSLYEALYGASPYAGTTIAQRVYAFTRGDVVVPRRRWIPRRVVAALQRGLAIEPSKRWPTMTPLLAELAPRSRPRVIAAAALGVALGGVAVLWSGDKGPQPCGQAAALAGVVWSPERAAQLTESFAATGLPYAQQAAAASVAELQTDIDDWIAAHTDACEATRVHGYQSDAVLAQRMQCLDTILLEVDVLANVLVHADAEIIARASEAAGALPSIDACADPEALAQLVELPADPRRREVARTLQRDLADARAHASVGGPHSVLDASEANVASARELGHDGLLAEALVDAATRRCFTGSVDPCEDAAREALSVLRRVRNDRFEAYAWSALVNAYSWREDNRRAIEVLPALDLAAARAGETRTVARALVWGATAFTEVGQFDDAQSRIDEAKHVLRDRPDPFTYSVVLDAAATLAERRGDLDVARQLRGQAALLLVTVNGAEHPMVANAFSSLATEEQVLGHPERAMSLLLRANEILVPLVADDSLQMAQNLNNLGVVMWHAERTAEARENLRMAEAIITRELGVGVHTAMTWVALAAVDRLEGVVSLAEARASDALDVLTSLVGEDDPRVAAALEELGEIAIARRDWSGAVARFNRALEVRERAGSAQADASLLGLARAHAAQGDARLAREGLQRVVDRSIDLGEPWRGHRLQAELELAQLDRAAGDLAGATARIETVAREAKLRGRDDYERRARAALAQ